MAILKIARMGHPVLYRPAKPVDDPGAPEVRKLVGDMIDTLDDAGGIGLAAPQVHVPLRVVIFFIPAHRAEQDEGEEGAAAGNGESLETPLTVMINPEIEPLTEETELDWEACLSVPGMMGAVPRYTRIKYRWTGVDGKAEERTASGFHARAVQHECDHLDGMLYPMRIRDMSYFGFAEELQRNPPPLPGHRDPVAGEAAKVGER